VLGGHTGEGKTTMALAIARAVALREEFLGWHGSGGRVLVIDAEQGLKTIKRRLREAGLEQCEAIDYVRVPDGLSLDSDAEHAGMVEALLADGDYALVLADPLYKLHSGDSNDERQAVELMRRFDAWRERYGFALLLAVHLRKPPQGASSRSTSSSAPRPTSAEVVVGLQRVREGYSRLYFFKDRDGDLPIGAAWGPLFDREQGFRRDPDDEKPKQTAGEVIASCLPLSPP
jgi:RecA-family ATPase